MQTKRTPRSNQARTRETRDALIAAARTLFAEKGYAETGTPEIVARAKVTRGALYHHFADKTDLFRAVLRAEFAAVASQIDAASGRSSLDAVGLLLAGADAFIAAMQEPGRARLMLRDGPAVLGQTEMDEIDRQTSQRTLRDGLDRAMRDGLLRPLPLDALTGQLSAMFDRAALAIALGADDRSQKAVIGAVIDGLRLTDR